jgi:hypothetical protein
MVRQVQVRMVMLLSAHLVLTRAHCFRAATPSEPGVKELVHPDKLVDPLVVLQVTFYLPVSVHQLRQVLPFLRVVVCR